MKQSAYRRVDQGAILDRTMHVSADSREELDDLIIHHQMEGWRVKSRTTSHDGTYMATLLKVTK